MKRRTYLRTMLAVSAVSAADTTHRPAAAKQAGYIDVTLSTKNYTVMLFDVI